MERLVSASCNVCDVHTSVCLRVYVYMLICAQWLWRYVFNYKFGLYKNKTSALFLLITGYLCGQCRDDKGVSALLNNCVSCGYVNILLIIALGHYIRIMTCIINVVY